MELWIGAVNLGFLYAFMAVGAFATFRVHDFPDITVDGSFTSGAAVAAVLLVSGVNPLLAVVAAFAVGAAAGAATGLISCKLKIDGLLAGILVMTGLYSVNLHIMGRSNIPLLKETTLFTYVDSANPGWPDAVWTCIELAALVFCFWFAVARFFKTDLGISIRATGNNSVMAAASGVNVDRMTICGVAAANGLIGVSGALVAQFQGFADIGMGIGTVVMGLASVIIGESVFRVRSFSAKVATAIGGSVIFRLMIAMALYLGMNPIDLKLITAVLVLVALAVPKLLANKPDGGRLGFGRIIGIARRRRLAMGVAAGGLVIAAGTWGYLFFGQSESASNRVFKIGVMQVVDHGALNDTREAFLAEMKRLGYEEGRNCRFVLQNANGDLHAVNQIIDKLLVDEVDLVFTISTPCTQPAISRIKDRPVVFSTVSDPFILGAGVSDTDHLPNVTGIYTPCDMSKTVDLTREILPRATRLGTLYDPSQANSEFEFSKLKEAVDAQDDLSLFTTHIATSSEVYQAALSLMGRDIDAFVLTPDNLVYSALEAVVHAANTGPVPVIASDVDRLDAGVLAALGLDYSRCGIQAAAMTDRILKGTSPRDIPFKRAGEGVVGLNLDSAHALGIEFPESLVTRAKVLHQDGRSVDLRREPSTAKTTGLPKRLVLFQFSDNMIMEDAAKGVLDELERSSVLTEYNVKIDRMNGQGEFSLVQSIAQDIVRKRYDYIVTLSTPALQTMAQVNKSIPHVFGAVTDPYRIGVAESTEVHQKNVTGVATFQPVESTIRTMRELFPDARSIGILWNPSEACSEACTLVARQAAGNFGFELKEVTISRTDEVMDAVRALFGKGVDLFLTSGDNTVSLAVEPIAAFLQQHGVPYFTNNSSDPERGAFVSIGADYFEVGRETGKMAIRVIQGKQPKDTAIQEKVPEKTVVNLRVARELGVSLPKSFLDGATTVE